MSSINGKDSVEKNEAILAEFKKILTLKEAEQIHKLSYLAARQNQTMADIQGDFNQYVQAQLIENFAEINNEKTNWIKRINLIQELLKVNCYNLSEELQKKLLDDYYEKDKINTKNRINDKFEPILIDINRKIIEAEIKNINDISNTIKRQIAIQKLSQVTGFSEEQCQLLRNQYRLDWSDFDFIIKAAAILTTIGVFSGLLTYWWETDKRRARENNESWSVINSAKEDSASSGRIDALNSLSSGCKATDNIGTWLMRKIGWQDDCVKLVGVNLNSANLPGVDMQKNDLSKAQLKNTNLQASQLQQATLWDANLAGANLRNSNLKDVDLRNANLEEVNLSHAILNGAVITNANLEGANLRNADMRNINLLNTSLKDVRMKGLIYNLNSQPLDWFKKQDNDVRLICDRAKKEETKSECQSPNLKAADLQEINLSNTYLKGANLTFANLRNSKLINADIREADLTQADIRGADFTGAILKNVTINHVIYDDNTKLDKSIFLNRPKFYKISLFSRSQDNSQTQAPKQDFQKANLSKADLRNADLRGANLTDARLEGADLRGANLEGANLKGATLEKTLYNKETKIDEENKKLFDDSKALYIENRQDTENKKDLVQVDLENKDLEKSSLREVDLTKANLKRINLIDSDLSKATLNNAELVRADLSLSKLKGAYIHYANLEYANLSGANLEKALLNGANLKNARLKSYLDTKTNLQDASLISADLESADLKNAVLINANLMMAKLKGTQLIQVDLRDANLEHADLRGANLIEADLSGTNLENADLRGANLSKIKFDSRTNFKGILIDEDTKFDFAKTDNNFNKEVAEMYEKIEKIAYFITKYRQPYWLKNDPKNPKTELVSNFSKANRYKGLITLSSNLNNCDPKDSKDTKQPEKVFSNNLPSTIDLSERDLTEVNFSCVDLTNIDAKGLKNTILEKANLINVNLKGVNLEGAKLDKAIYDQRTIEKLDNPKYQILFDRAYKINPNSDLSDSELSDHVLNSLDLTEANLREADLQRTDLKSTRFNNACLRKANLKNANLQEVDLTGADLSKADLKDANLHRANLAETDLRGADLTGAKLDGVKNSDQIIHDSETKYSSKYKSLFSRVNNPNPKSGEKIICKIQYQDSPKTIKFNQPVDYSNINNLDLSGINFSNYEFAKNSKFNNAQLRNSNFSKTILSFVDFTDADLTGADFTDADLTGADFSGANLKKVIGLTIEQLKTVKSLTGTQFSPELCQLVKKEITNRGKIADCTK